MLSKVKKQRAPYPSRFDPTVFARRVLALIDEQDLSMRVVAERSDVDCGVLSRIASGETVEPRLPTIWNLADYFGVSLDYLTGRNRKGGESVPEELATLWGKLSADQRKALLAQARTMATEAS